MLGTEQLETDLVAAEQAVADIKAAAEAMHQELQDQYRQRDATTVQISQYCLEGPWTNSLTPRPSWKKQRHYMRRNLPI